METTTHALLDDPARFAAALAGYLGPREGTTERPAVLLPVDVLHGSLVGGARITRVTLRVDLDGLDALEIPATCDRQGRWTVIPAAGPLLGA